MAAVGAKRTRHTGARIGEITQLRQQDIHRKDGVWLVWITPEAGPVKAGNARYVAIDPQLLEQRIIEFVEAYPRETLFCDARPQLVDELRRSSASKAAENLSRWVRPNPLAIRATGLDR